MKKTFSLEEIAQLQEITLNDVKYFGFPLVDKPVTKITEAALNEILNTEYIHTLKKEFYADEMNRWVKILQPIAAFYEDYKVIDLAYNENEYKKNADVIHKGKSLIKNLKSTTGIYKKLIDNTNRLINQAKANQTEESKAEFIKLSKERSRLKHEFKKLTHDVFGEKNNYPHSRYFKISTNHIEEIVRCYTDFKENIYKGHERSELHWALEDEVLKSDEYRKARERIVKENYQLIKRK